MMIDKIISSFNKPAQIKCTGHMYVSLKLKLFNNKRGQGS